MTKIFVKVHKGVVAMADEDVIGKEFEEGDKFLQVTERFYKGEIKSVQEVVAIMNDATNLNLVGNTVVGIALKEGFIKEKDVIIIQGVSHVQIYNILSD